MSLVDIAALVATPPTATGEPVPPVLQPDAADTVVLKPTLLTPMPAWSVGPAPSSATQSEQVGVISHLLPGSETAVKNAAGAALTGWAALTTTTTPEPTSAGTEVPLKGKPQPSSPTVPLENVSFGMSGSGQTSSGGIGVSLLMGVLLWSMFLLRRQDGFLLLISWELPKPGSALLAPLERPG
jgi:hypothetical protein